VIVAEGRWSSSNPEHLVHFQRLGLGACRVFVDVVKVKDASVWRTSSEIEYMEDALGSTLAWPEDKIITVRVLFIFFVLSHLEALLHKCEPKVMSFFSGLTKEQKEPDNYLSSC